MSEKPVKYSGFTLIELIMALVVAGILMVWAVPSLTGYIDRTTLTSATNDWVGAINLARSEAIKRGQRVTICRRPVSMFCRGDIACQCGVSIPGDSGVANYHPGYLIFTSQGNAQPLNFDPGLGNVLIKSGSAMPAKVRAQGNGFGNNAFSFMPDGTLDPNDVGAGTASHVICFKSDASDDSTAQSTGRVPGRLVTIAASGRPRAAPLTAGASCDGNNYDSASG
jgi:type IV fimbrial biogenesis protein FimT